MSDSMKKRHITRELGSSGVSVPLAVYSSAFVQAIIPIPILGGVVGGVAGGYIGNAVGGIIGGGIADWMGWNDKNR